MDDTNHSRALYQTDWAGSVEAMLDKHEAVSHEAAKQGAQVICFQELFHGPYLCQVQDTSYYSYTEPIPDGPTTQRFQSVAKETGMVMILPLYEVVQPGLYYNTAAVIDADGTYLGKYRKQHIPRRRDSGSSSTSVPAPAAIRCRGRGRQGGCLICYDRHFPEAGGPRAQRRRTGLQPVGRPPRPVGVHLAAGTAGLRGGQHLFDGCDRPGEGAPDGDNDFYVRATSSIPRAASGTSATPSSPN